MDNYGFVPDEEDEDEFLIHDDYLPNYMLRDVVGFLINPYQ